MAKRFSRTKEDFVCERCGTEVTGTGYTNHCPQCLWSKHVDINPGDRAERCGGMMSPEHITKNGDTYVLTHRCKRCNFERKNKINNTDNFESVLLLVQEGKLS